MSTSARARRPRQPKPAAGRTLSVRMYDVGFGDCFLLRIPTLDGKTRQVLFDCGSIKNGARPFKNVVRQLLKELRDTPTAGTHRCGGCHPPSQRPCLRL